jgi:hypothetical protein
MAIPPGILTEEHYELCKQIHEACAQCQPLLKFCRDIGLPMTNAEEQLAAQAQLATLVKQHAFPDKP